MKLDKIRLPISAEEEAGWHLAVFPDWQLTFYQITDVGQLLSHPQHIIQQTKHSLVLLVSYNQIPFIAKRSLTQERRLWAQLTSLYRRGEGTRTLRNMHKMYTLGLPVPEPVLVLEKHRLGCVVASWSVYRYLEGETCTFDHAPQIARTLKQMHQLGWVHRDPHVWNFLEYHGEIRILDCARARPWRGKYAQMYDVVLLDKCVAGSASHYGISENDWVYRLAKRYNLLLQWWRKAKRTLRFWRT